jgi:hypothetical protein
VKFGERGKSSGRHPPTSVFKRGLTVSLTNKGVLTWSRGSIGFVSEVFEVITQVDLGLTSASRFDSADSIISGNNANQKPEASQVVVLF